MEQVIELFKTEIERFAKEKNLDNKHANDLEQGYINGLYKAIELIEDNYVIGGVNDNEEE